MGGYYLPEGVPCGGAVAVLAPGPSLTETWAGPGPGVGAREAGGLGQVVVAVNTAGWLYQSDWLCFLDERVWTGMRAPPWRGVITPVGVEVEAPVMRVRPWLYDSRGAACPEVEHMTSVSRCNYSFPCALYEAGVLAGGSPVHVHGFDCLVGRADAAGQGGDRGLHRWRLELPWIRQVWQAAWTNHGRAPEPIMSWVRGETPWWALEEALSCLKT